jgi:hypothetical protein
MALGRIRQGSQTLEGNDMIQKFLISFTLLVDSSYMNKLLHMENEPIVSSLRRDNRMWDFQKAANQAKLCLRLDACISPRAP